MEKKEAARKQYKARLLSLGDDPTKLVIARKAGEGFFIDLGGEWVELTVIRVADNSVAILIETPEKNLILRKELLDEC